MTMKLIPALLLAVCSSYASAAGFQLTEQNASGLGNAYAGQGAVAENASTIFFNPAGMTQLREREASVGLTAVRTSFKFSNNGSNVGFLAGTGNGGDGGGWGFIPNAYLSWAINKDLYVGVGVGAPFGLKTEYDNPWLGAAQSTKFDLKTLNINPSIAYRVNDTVSLGFGLDFQRLTAEYTRQVAVNTAINAASPLKLTLDDNSLGWNIGALFAISPTTKLGVTYRSEVKYDLRGQIVVASTGVNANTVNAASSNAKADLTLPATFSLSLAQKVSDPWQILADVTWTNWSKIPKLDVIRTSQTALYIPGFAGQTTGDIAQTLLTDFRDTWRVGLGGIFKYNDAWKLKCGIAYDQTPVKNDSTRLVSLPDNDRTWLSFGAQWAPSKGSAVDLGVAYLYLKDAAINNNQAAAGRGTVTGNYNDSAWILGAQYSMAF
jgi:long-chain fatty acid transport protein